MKKTIFFVAIGVASFILLNSSAHANEQLIQHKYSEGEILKYLFEDTESTFNSTEVPHVGYVPKNQVKYEELEIGFSIKVQRNSAGDIFRILTFENATYAGEAPDKFKSSLATPISKLVPSFPANFSYQYSTDAQAVTSVVGKAYSPYMSSPVGLFVYYKALDVHTIQGVIDNIPANMKPGDFIQKSPKDIPIHGGTFHNAEMAIHYQKIENFEGIRCAYFKVTTMGNKYSYENENGKVSDIYTNYQYTFYVPLEGKFQGLLLRGDLQETVTTPDGSIDQRQFSMKLAR